MEPASSSSVQPPSGSRLIAARAIRSFSAALTRSRSGSWASSTVTDRIGTAPPCTRRTQPEPLQRGEVAAHGLGGHVELRRRARSPTPGRGSATSSAMACWRSSAYMSSCSCVLGRVESVYMLFYVPNVLTVKGCTRVDCGHGHRQPPPAGSGAHGLLRGTPVVPGLAYGPALLVAQPRSRPSAIGRVRRRRATPTPTRRSRRTTRPPQAVADGFARKAAAGQRRGLRGAGRHGVADAGQGPALRSVRKRLNER